MMEKRKKSRIDSENLIHLFLEDQDQVVRQGMGKTLNISEIGLLIETGFPLCPGDRASIEIGLEEDIVHVDGEIVRVDAGEKGKSEAGIALSQPELRIGEKIEKEEAGTAAERSAAPASNF
jgi:hypothetical protein